MVVKVINILYGRWLANQIIHMGRCLLFKKLKYFLSYRFELEIFLAKQYSRTRANRRINHLLQVLIRKHGDKNKTLTQFWFNGEPASHTLAHYWNNIGLKSRSQSWCRYSVWKQTVTDVCVTVTWWLLYDRSRSYPTRNLKYYPNISSSEKLRYPNFSNVNERMLK